MSTILDALRKAQAKNEQDEAGAVAERDGDDAELASDEPRPPASDDLDNFDDLDRPERLSASAKSPGTLVALAVGLIGLTLGVGAARMVAGKLPLFGGSEETVEIAASSKPRTKSPAEDDSKKSTPLADVTEPSGDDRRVSRESRSRGTRSLKVERGPTDAPAPEPPVEASAAEPQAVDAGVPVLAPGPEQQPSPPAEVLAGAGAPLAPPAGIAQPNTPQATAPPPPVVAPQPSGVAAGSPVQTAALEPPGRVPGAAVPGTAVPGPVPGTPVPGATVPGAAVPGTPVPGEPSTGTVLEIPPSGAPEVSLLFIKWSRDVQGRVASLRGPGGKLMLVHEGDIVEGMRVSAIRADAIELQWRGTNFLLYAAR